MKSISNSISQISNWLGNLTLFTAKFLARYWAKIDKRDASDCWPWTGAVRPSPSKVQEYGHIKLEKSRKTVLAHRVSYAIAHDIELHEVPPLLRHTCDFGRCTNPSHLLAGDTRSNYQDALERGLMRLADQRGEMNGYATLRDCDIPIIRNRIMMGETNKAISLDYGVHHATISDIRRGRTWTHLAA